MSDEEDAQKVGQMLIEFFYLNKISRPTATTAMLGLYMSACSELGVPWKEMRKRFDACMERYRKK